MLTRSRSFLLSLAAGLMLVVSSVGCDVEDPTDSEESVEETSSLDEALTSETSLPKSAQDRVGIVNVRSRSAAGVLGANKNLERIDSSNAPSIGIQVQVDSGDTTNLGFQAVVVDEKVGAPVSLGATKGEPEPEPWAPGEPEPEPWMPDPDGKDDRR